MADPSQKAWINSASLALAILSFINLFNYLDRFVVSALVESLKHSELALSDSELGSLQSGFLIVFTLVAPIFGALGDRRSRPRLIAFGVGCWSVATALSAFVGSFAALFAARASVGIGEAAYVTIAPSLLSDYYPRSQRGRVMAIFFCAIPVGSALGYVVGGLIDVHFGWRMAFFVAGVPGVILAVLCLRLRDPPRGSQDTDSPPIVIREPMVNCRQMAKTDRRPPPPARLICSCYATSRMCSPYWDMRHTHSRWVVSPFGSRRFSNESAAYPAPTPP